MTSHNRISIPTSALISSPPEGGRLRPAAHRPAPDLLMVWKILTGRWDRPLSGRSCPNLGLGRHLADGGAGSSPALKWTPPKTTHAVDRRPVANPVQARTLLHAVGQQRGGRRLDRRTG